MARLAPGLEKYPVWRSTRSGEVPGLPQLSYMEELDSGPDLSLTGYK